jgi:aminopeptidase N
MKKTLINFVLIATISTTIFGQYIPEEMKVCKPLEKMARQHGMMARSIADIPMNDYDVHYYDLAFSFSISDEILYGTSRIHFTSLANDLSQITIDLSSEFMIDSVFFGATSYQRSGNQVTLTLVENLTIDQTGTIGITYHGHPVENGFQAFTFETQSGIPMLSTLSEPYGASTWWACKDINTDKADSLKVAVTIESNYTAVSNGMLTEEINNFDGTKTFVWEHGYLIAPYLVSLAITEYEYWNDTYYFASGDSMLLEYWMYPSSATTTNINRWNRTPLMLDAYNEYYGDYPFAEEKYGMAQFNWGGAMEHQTCSSMGSSSENTIAHELGHQWWGDLVTCSDFHHIWINEGFATYSEALYWGSLGGEADYHSHMASKDINYTGSIYRTDTTNVWSIFDYIVYGKGAWTLHMLRHVVGDDAFFQILHDYRETYQFSTASTEDFQAVAESVYGSSLGWFFAQWIYGSGKPYYRWWWAEDADYTGNLSQIKIHIDQIQSVSYPTFKMPIDLKIGDSTYVIWDSLRTQEFTIELDQLPINVELDPIKWIHRSANQVSSLGNRFLAPNTFIVEKAYPNPFNGTVFLDVIMGYQFSGIFKVYDIRGREIYSQDIQSDGQELRTIQWNGLNSTNGAEASAGIYILSISNDIGLLQTKKVSFIK